MRFPANLLIALTCIAVPTQLRAQSERSTASIVQPASYTLRPGDVIRLRIWREPDLSGDFPVDEYGRVNLPLVGTYPVAGESRQSLQEKLVAAYRTSIQNLSMDVIFIRRVPVVGAVRTPGLYPIDATMTVSDALAAAGGFVADVRQFRVQLLRSGAVVIDNVDPAVLVSQLPIARGDQLYVPPQREEFFTRNPWVIGTALQTVLAVITLYRR